MKFLVVFISFWLLSFQFVSAQNSGEILARIIDTETSEPISFATVRLKNSNQGVIADYNGEFRIPLQFKNSVIVITSIGYEAKEIPLIELNQENLNIIKLKTQIEALDPVFISVNNKVKNIEVNPEEIIKKNKKLSAKEIVLKAIREIPKNLSDKPHSYIGYYRDYQLINNKFINLNEGILETFDKGINSSFLDSDDVSSAVYSFSQNQNFTIDPSLTKAYDGVTKYIKHSQILPRGGNEYTILNIHNPIRNYNINSFSYVYRMDTDFTQLHKFSKGKIIFLNNEPLILIEFKKAKPHDNSLYGLKTGRNKNNDYVKGSIFISLVDFSIHRFNYLVHPPESKKPLYNVNLEYLRQNDKMYLNYITFNNSFEIGGKYVLREEKVEFDKAEQTFYITFNNTKAYLDMRTIIPKNFRFKFKGKSLKTIDIDKESGRVFKIKVESYDGSLIDINSENIDQLSYKLKRIKDVIGREIYQHETVKGDQFREFFVQQINLDKSTSDGIVVMDKNLPIKNSFLNEFTDKDQYWLNTPLMDKKYRNLKD